MCPTQRGSQETKLQVFRGLRLKSLTVQPDSIKIRTAGSTCKNVILIEYYGQEVRRTTWIEEDNTLLESSRGILDDRKVCRSGRAVVMVYWNLEVSALQAGFRVIDSQALIAAPRKFQGAHKV